MEANNNKKKTNSSNKNAENNSHKFNNNNNTVATIAIIITVEAKREGRHEAQRKVDTVGGDRRTVRARAAARHLVLDLVPVARRVTLVDADEVLGGDGGVREMRARVPRRLTPCASCNPLEEMGFASPVRGSIWLHIAQLNPNSFATKNMNLHHAWSGPGSFTRPGPNLWFCSTAAGAAQRGDFIRVRGSLGRGLLQYIHIPIFFKKKEKRTNKKT